MGGRVGVECHRQVIPSLSEATALAARLTLMVSRMPGQDRTDKITVVAAAAEAISAFEGDGAHGGSQRDWSDFEGDVCHVGGGSSGGGRVGRGGRVTGAPAAASSSIEVRRRRREVCRRRREVCRRRCDSAEGRGSGVAALGRKSPRRGYLCHLTGTVPSQRGRWQREGGVRRRRLLGILQSGRLQRARAGMGNYPFVSARSWGSSGGVFRGGVGGASHRWPLPLVATADTAAERAWWRSSHRGGDSGLGERIPAEGGAFE